MKEVKKMQQEIFFPPYDIKMVLEEIRDDEIADMPGALDTGKEQIDPVTFSVISARVRGIIKEMTATVLATARNPILYAVKDFSCILMTPKAELLDYYDNLPEHSATTHPPLRWIIRVFKGDIHEGDVFVNNSPYCGNAHVGEWSMYAPIFYEGKLVGWSANKCHLIDTGAHVPTNIDPFAKDVYEEAMHFPGVRLCRDHKMIPDIIRFIGYNFRYSRQWYGDFLAQLGSLWVGESRVIELCDRFGYDVVKGAFKEILRYGDRLMTEEIRKLPKITVEEEMLSEKFEGYCPDGLKLKMKLSVDPDKALLTFDYRDMPDQLPWGYNLTFATSYVTAIISTFLALSPRIPKNEGAFKHIKVLMREGAICGIPRWPVGTSNATLGFGEQVDNLCMRAWAKIIPEAEALAGTGEYPAANYWVAGVDRSTNEPYSHAYYVAMSGAGASGGNDGLAQNCGYAVSGNMALEFIETVELAIPHIVWDVFAVTDSGGAGKWRGGIGGGQIIQPREHDMTMIYGGTGHTSAPFGLFGGLPGSLADHWIIDQDTGEVVKHLKNAGHEICKASECWKAITSGGGGYGDPLERDPEAVRDDVRDGFVSLKAARDIYKVIINTEPELYEVDYPATEKLRAEAKKERE